LSGSGSRAARRFCFLCQLSAFVYIIVDFPASSIPQAGRTDPIGVIVLVSDSGNLKIAGGAGMLLRVNSNGRI